MSTMTAHSTPSDGQTRLAYILGVPLAPHCQRQWPQMGEVVSGRDLIAEVEGQLSGTHPRSRPTTSPRGHHRRRMDL